MAPSWSTPPLPLLLLHLLLHPIHAQSTAAPPPPPGFTSTSFNSSMAIIIVILVTAFFFLGFFSIYLRQCGGNRDEPTVRPRTTAGARSRRGSRGLDPSAISKFPTLVYSDVKEHKIGKGALECAVCLSEFEDDETLRLLPHCDHVFHTECIDTWLSSHTTCPVCRDNLAVVHDGDLEIPSSSSAPPAEEVAIEMPPAPAASATVEEELRRMGSRSVGRRLLSKWRSRSARPAAMQYWEEDERERFTLRLPESVRREILAGKLNRSASVSVAAVERGGLQSGRRGYRGEGSGRGGRSFKMSDRWAAFISRPLSFKLGRGGGDGEGSSVRKGSADGGEAENSTRGKVFARVPLDCIGGDGVHHDSGDGEGPTVPFTKV